MKILLTAPDAGAHPGFARTPSPLGAKIVHSGNSLTDCIFVGGTWPDVGINNLVKQYSPDSTPLNYKSTIPGSSMAYRWAASAEATPDAKATMGDYDVLVITDNSGNFNTNSYPPTQAQIPADALLWADLAWTIGRGGLGAEVMLWCPWARTDVANIPAQYEVRFTLWPQIQDYCNSNLPAGRKKINLIPGAWLWYEFYKDQQAGTAPTLTWYDDLYVDEVHPTDAGRYISAALHMACIYGIDPTLIPPSLPGVTALTSPQLAYVRAKIKQVVTAVKRSGVDTSTWA